MSHTLLVLFAIVGFASTFIVAVFALAGLVAWICEYQENSAKAKREKKHKQYLKEYNIPENSELAAFTYGLIYKSVSDDTIRYYLNAVSKDNG